MQRALLACTAGFRLVRISLISLIPFCCLSDLHVLLLEDLLVLLQKQDDKLVLKSATISSGVHDMKVLLQVMLLLYSRTVTGQ